MVCGGPRKPAEVPGNPWYPLKLPLTNLLLTVLYVCANTLLNFPALLMPKKLQKFWAFMYKQIRIFSKKNWIVLISICQNP